MEKLRKIFVKCGKASLCLHPEKYFFDMKEGILFRHEISLRGIAVDHDKIVVIMALEVPTNLHEFRGFLGDVGYYR